MQTIAYINAFRNPNSMSCVAMMKNNRKEQHCGLCRKISSSLMRMLYHLRGSPL